MRYLVDIIGDIVSDVRAEYDTEGLEPYYIYGHPTEIAERLSIKDASDEFRFKKYPLIALITDFTEQHGADNFEYSVPFKILIVASTKPDYNSEERYTNTFKPVLYPIYDLFLQKLYESEYTSLIDVNLTEHTKIDRLYWGRAGLQGNEGLLFNDYLDAIELDFEPIDIIRQQCTK